jgi:hypothetical protein
MITLGMSNSVPGVEVEVAGRSAEVAEDRAKFAGEEVEESAQPGSSFSSVSLTVLCLSSRPGRSKLIVASRLL